MKIAYLYFNDLKRVDIDGNIANVSQTLNMVHHFGEHADIYFFSSFIKKKEFDERLKFLGLSKNFRHKRLIVPFSKSNKFLEFFLRTLYSFQALIVLRFINVQYIYTRDFSFLYFLSLLPRFLRPNHKIIYEPHKIYHLITDKVTYIQEKNALDIPSLFIPISKGIEGDLIRVFGIEKKRIHSFPSGVKIEHFNNAPDRTALRKIFGIKNHEKLIIYAGSFLSWKGVEILIEAYSQISMQHKNSKLILIGGSKKDIFRIEKFAKDLHVDNGNLILKKLLPHRELIKYLKMSDIGVIPNLKTLEGGLYTSPLKVGEYLAAGLALIVSDLPALRENLNHNNAVFFEPYNPADLANKLGKLMDNDKKLQKLQKNNLKKAVEYTWDRRTRKILSTLKKSDL
jgi:glycosyltransferase involved in cell wall biosynthesis